MEVPLDTISRERIESAERIIRPYIRRTPVVAIAGSDFGLDAIPITLKLGSSSIPARSRRAARLPIC